MYGKSVALFIQTPIFVLLLLLIFAATPNSAGAKEKTIESIAEGKLEKPTMTAGPFPISRKYRSMEGPYVDFNLSVGEIIDTGNLSTTEAHVRYTEKSTPEAPPLEVRNKHEQDRKLYWFKGMKVEVLDENDKALPSSEFVCHVNLDSDLVFRQSVFPEAEKASSGRLLCLTQGLTEIFFPEGFAVPVASDEPWRIITQVANRTTEKTRTLKHRLTFYFEDDQYLLKPVKALSWSIPYLAVVVDRNTKKAQTNEAAQHAQCAMAPSGVDAPNSVAGSVWDDSYGRKRSSHWVVPPGKHDYSNPVNTPNFADKDRVIHTAWAHIHPFCEEFSLAKCDGQPDSEKIFSGKARTKTSKGIEIQKIDLISSNEGIPLKASKNYQLKATYNNTSKEAQDSMVTIGIFFADENFARPEWALHKTAAVHCDMRPGEAGSDSKKESCNLH